MRNPAAAIWPTVHAERRRLATDLSKLHESQWSVPSLCPDWTIHDVLSHLADTARTGRVSFARDLLTARMDFDRANEIGIARTRRNDPRDTLAAFGDTMHLTRTPPAALTTRLVEAIVHGEDIRRPLGLAGSYPDQAVLQALGYQLRTRVSFGGGRERVSGLRLVDRQTGTSWGQGDDVEGDPLDLLMAVSGRPVGPDAFAGSGAQLLIAAAQP